MSRFNQPPSDKLLLEAVELRIGGFRWEIVAERLKRAFNTVRKWPMRYPERWEKAIERAEQRLTVDSNAESVVVLRNMLRADDIKMRWHAAKTLVGLRVDLGKLGLRIVVTRAASGQIAGAETDQEYQYYRFLQQHSDEELAQLADVVRCSPSSRSDEHGQSGHAREAAECNRDSTCVATPPRTASMAKNRPRKTLETKGKTMSATREKKTPVAGNGSPWKRSVGLGASTHPNTTISFPPLGLELIQPEVVAAVVLHRVPQFVPPARLLERRVRLVRRRADVRVTLRLGPLRAVLRPVAVREVVVGVVGVTRKRRLRSLWEVEPLLRRGLRVGNCGRTV